MRAHPADTDTYKMVSLYFTMYREIAAMLEDAAHRQLVLLCEKPLGRSRLKVTPQGHASRSHLKVTPQGHT